MPQKPVNQPLAAGRWVKPTELCGASRGGPAPPAQRPVLCWWMCAVRVRQTTCIASERPVRARLSVTGRARNRVQHRLLNARPVKARHSGAGRAGRAVCVHVRAVCVADPQRGCASSVAALAGHRRREHVEESPRGRFRRRRLGVVSNLTWPKAPPTLPRPHGDAFAPPIGNKHGEIRPGRGHPCGRCSLSHHPQST